VAASCPPPPPLQASPDLELGAPEPRENRGTRRLRKSPGKGTGIRRLLPTFFRQKYHPQIFCLKPYLHGQATLSGEGRMGQEKERRKENG
jgi:hypothetical protein